MKNTLAPTGDIKETFTIDNLRVNLKSKKLPYRSNAPDENKAVDWVTRKSLMSDIEFLSLYWDDKIHINPICVYIGNTTKHITVLSRLFNKFTFYVYSTNLEISETDKIKVFNYIPTLNELAKYQNNSFLISDYQSTNYNDVQKSTFSKYGLNIIDNVVPTEPIEMVKIALEESENINEQNLANDLTLQRQWVNQMNPIFCSLRFKVPSNSKSFTYFKGYVYFQPWSKQISYETRLVPSKEYNLGEWDNEEYQEILFNHNIDTRQNIYYNNIFTYETSPIDDTELLNDYDSTLEAMILKIYIERTGISSVSDLYVDVKKLSRMLTWYLNDKTTQSDLANRRTGLITKHNPFRDKTNTDQIVIPKNISITIPKRPSPKIQQNITLIPITVQPISLSSTLEGEISLDTLDIPASIMPEKNTNFVDDIFDLLDSNTTPPVPDKPNITLNARAEALQRIKYRR